VDLSCSVALGRRGAGFLTMPKWPSEGELPLYSLGHMSSRSSPVGSLVHVLYIGVHQQCDARVMRLWHYKPATLCIVRA
jgi:hypothetical protein